MYIIKTTDGFRLAAVASPEAVAEIRPPVLEENGREFRLYPERCGDMEAHYSGFGYAASYTAADLGSGLFSVERTITNTDAVSHTFKTVFEVKTRFVPDKYLIPCVNYNGNQWGEGKEPKGLYHENGEAWVYAYDRTGIPSCSVCENAAVALSLFASSRDADSLRSSCSIIRGENGTLCQRIHHPVTEAPFTYCENDKYTDRYDETITLQPGERFCVELYVLASVPRYKNYGIADTLDRVLELMPFTKSASLPPEEIWRCGIEYARTLISTAPDGKKLSSIGITADPSSGVLVHRPEFEIGWCGQNILSCRMQILDHIQSGRRELLDDALEMIDNWVVKQADNGLILAHYEWYTKGRDWNYVPRDPSKSWASHVAYKTGWLPETCNLGWAAAEMMKTYDLLHSIGIDKPAYRDFSLKICDFFVEHYSPVYGFGKSWNFDGTVAEEDGSIGGFITMALIEVYKITREPRYLQTAAASMDLYFKRDIDEFVCTAGAIDCTCVDKETAGPFIISALDLYEITGEKRYIDYALRASYYFCSWLFHYDVLYGPEAEFTQYGYYTTGSTAVSTQHPALDQWGELMCPEFLRLYRITGDEKWRIRAKMMWYNATQLIATEDSPPIHGVKRPVGSQNEAFYQCRWGHRADCNERGHLNDWLVAWVNLFRLTVLDRLKTVLGDGNFDALR